LLAGNELLARQIVVDLFLARHSLSAICDEVVAAAFHEIGQRWACRQADVYQERRGCEITTRILFDLRGMQPPPDEDCRAIGGTIEGDNYSLPTMMAELVLRDCGCAATSLGTSVPVGSLISAIGATSPKIFWLSVSHIAESIDFISDFSQLSKACRAADVALVVGGRALSQELRQRMVYSAFCDTMQQLESFARSLYRNSRRTGKRKPVRTRQ
jgi:methanogenic corrinoid protein MtbC1